MTNHLLVRVLRIFNFDIEVGYQYGRILTFGSTLNKPIRGQ